MAAFRTRTHPRAAVLAAAIASLVLAVVSFGVPESSSPSVTNSNKPALRGNGERYKNDAAPVRNGKSGGAQVMARALQDKLGTTVLELTTGDLNSDAAAPGNISKVKIRIANSKGVEQFVQNYNGLSSGGSLAFSFEGLALGETLEISAHVQGVTKGTDVVTFNEVIRKRPDLWVPLLSAPQETTVETPVNIVATVQEKNHEIGEKADCILAVDDVEVDRARGVWVDAGGTVSCAFTHSFDKTGSRKVKVSVGNSTPGDYDELNNSTTMTVQAYARPTAQMQFSANVSDYKYDFGSRIDGTFRSVSGTGNSDWTTTTTASGWIQHAYFQAFIPAKVTFPLRNLSVSQYSGGNTFTSKSYDSLAADTNAGGRQCVLRFDKVAYTYLYVCTSVVSGGTTSITYVKHAGDVTYFSTTHQRTWNQDSSGNQTDVAPWTWNTTTTPSVLGEKMAIGSSYSFSVKLIDGDVLYQANPTLSFVPMDQQIHKPSTCRSTTTTAGVKQLCESDDYSFVGRQANSTGAGS